MKSTAPEPLRRDLATLKTQQDALTPAEVIEPLKRGNEHLPLRGSRGGGCGAGDRFQSIG